MSIDKKPCFECDKRCHLCHSTCEDYHKYKRELAERSKKIRKSREVYYLLSNAKLKMILRKTNGKHDWR